MKRIITILAILIGFLSMCYGVMIHMQSVDAQDDEINFRIINEIVSKLQKQHIPVKFNKLTIDPNGLAHSIVELTLQSSSDAGRMSPDDPIYLNKVLHEVNIAQKDGLNIESISVSIINNQGKILCEIIQKTNPIASMFETIGSNYLSEGDISELIEKDCSLHGMSLDNATVSIEDGFSRCILNLRVSDIKTANEAVPYFMIDIYNTMVKLNAEKGTQIITYQVNISTINGEILLKYINDLQLRVENWWQNEDLTQDWFPHPKHVSE